MGFQVILSKLSYRKWSHLIFTKQRGKGVGVGGMDSQGSKDRLCHHVLLTAHLSRGTGPREARPLNGWGFSGKLHPAGASVPQALSRQLPFIMALSPASLLTGAQVRSHSHARTCVEKHVSTGSTAALGLHLATTVQGRPVTCVAHVQ